MANIKDYASDEFLSLQRVKDAEKKLAVICDAGTLETYDNKESFKVLIEFDGERLYWRVNKTTAKTFIKEWGADTKVYVGKAVELSVGSVRGKEAILGKPVNPAVGQPS